MNQAYIIDQINCGKVILLTFQEFKLIYVYFRRKRSHKLVSRRHLLFRNIEASPALSSEMIHRLEIFEIHCCKSCFSSFSLLPEEKINNQMAEKKTENDNLFVVLSLGKKFLVTQQGNMKCSIGNLYFMFHAHFIYV